MHSTPTERFVWSADPIKGSRFMAWIHPVSTEAEASSILQEARGEHNHATHHCWAWCLADGRTRSSDDGEPGGSAGRPILAQIEGHNAADLIVVVIRWYGGTKLGVGGLIRAYGGTAGMALDRAPMRMVVDSVELTFRHSYSDTSAVDAVLARFTIQGIERRFEADVHCTLRIEPDLAASFTDALTERTAGRVQIDRSR